MTCDTIQQCERKLYRCKNAKFVEDSLVILRNRKKRIDEERAHFVTLLCKITGMLPNTAKKIFDRTQYNIFNVKDFVALDNGELLMEDFILKARQQEQLEQNARIDLFCEIYTIILGLTKRDHNYEHNFINVTKIIDFFVNDDGTKDCELKSPAELELVLESNFNNFSYPLLRVIRNSLVIKG